MARPREPPNPDHASVFKHDYVHEPEQHGLDNAHVAAGKAISCLLKMESLGFCGVEKNSVYGSAVAIPQIARSVGWSTSFTALAIRSWIFLSFNILLQCFLLCLLNEEMHVFNPFGGRMHLCDFGAGITSCPDGPNCVGPGGTEYAYHRLYGYTVWHTRSFIRNSLEEIFPDRKADIDELIDPGEYGLEDYYCRLVCCLIFMMAVVDDLKGTFGLWYLLAHMPTEAESWIRYEVPKWENKEKAKIVHGWAELDLVKFQVAGMPWGWKVFNFVCILCPKIMIWWTLCSSGFHFLMETSGIVDLVVNCMALTFVLDIDEQVFDRLATVAAKHIMENLKDKALFSMDIEEQETELEAAQRFDREEVGHGKWGILKYLVPKQLLAVFVFQIIFILQYYYENCQQQEDGSWISKDLYLPMNVKYNPVAFMFDSFLAKHETPDWTMPAHEEI